MQNTMEQNLTTSLRFCLNKLLFPSGNQTFSDHRRQFIVARNLAES